MSVTAWNLWVEQLSACSANVLQSVPAENGDCYFTAKFQQLKLKKTLVLFNQMNHWMAILSSFERRASVSAHTLHRDGSTVYDKLIFYSHLKLHLPQQRATWTLFLACTHWTALLSTCQLHTCQPSGGTRPGAIPRMFVQEEQELKLQATHLILLPSSLASALIQLSWGWWALSPSF